MAGAAPGSSPVADPNSDDENSEDATRQNIVAQLNEALALVNEVDGTDQALLKAIKNKLDLDWVPLALDYKRRNHTTWRPTNKKDEEIRKRLGSELAMRL